LKQNTPASFSQRKVGKDARSFLWNYVFRDRVHAGELLANKLKPYVGKDSIVLAIPSGGVPIGSTIAKELGLQMDLIIVRKLPIPYNTEAGFGSMLMNFSA